MGSLSPAFDQAAALQGIAGGLLIGAAALVLFAFNGRLAGISSIAGNALLLRKRDVAWRVLFIVGLVAGAALYGSVTDPVDSARPEFPAWLLALAGVLVGIGTGMASGCTSGHGVCGLARFSLRSFIATGLFLVTAIVTTYVVRHVFAIA